MADIVEEYKRKQRERTKRTIITTVVVFIVLIATFAYSIHDDKQRQRDLDTFGGAVGVENKTAHSVTLHLFVHEGSEETVLTHTIEPQGYWVIQDSMSKKEVSDFPPRNWMDSGHIVFDDTLLLRHSEHPVWRCSYNAHCIHDPAHWRYNSLTVRNANRYHPALYRPLRVYYITDEDYNRALQPKKNKLK